MGTEFKNKGYAMRWDGRAAFELRSLKLKMNVNKFAEGSCLVVMGQTQVLCTASIQEGVPGFLKGTGKGWVTAEYSMLPRSCSTRIERDITKGKLNGRSSEIQRLIGRSLRSIIDLKALGERTIWIDCDVLQGDGGTRCAAITGAYTALESAVQKLLKSKILSKTPLVDQVAAVSVGIVSGKPALDLCYKEDAGAEVDMNVVMTGRGKFVEVQGTAEGQPFSDAELKKLLSLAKTGIRRLLAAQRKALGR